MTKEISFLAQQISSEAGYFQDRQRRHMTKVDATLSSLEESNILSQFSVQEILEDHGRDAFLEVIGEDYAREYFGIEATDGIEGE